MNDYTTTAQEIIDTVDFDGITSADLAVHLEIDFDHMNDVEDGIRVKNEDGIIRCWGIERDEQGRTLGYSYVLGRDKAHAERCALIDALLQQPQTHALLTEKVITPLAALREEQRQLRAREIASSKVDFFTLVRGDN